MMRLADPAVTAIATDVAMAESMLSLDGARVLDLGAGAAAFSRAIAKAHPSAHVTALEVDRKQHAKNLASEKPANLLFGIGGAESIVFDDGTFDVVSTIKSLHHVPLDRLDDALREIHRVLKPGGHYFALEPVFAGEFNEITRVFHDEERVRLAAFEAVRRAIDGSLFTLVEERFFLAEMRYPDFASFEARHIGVTHTEHHLTPEQLAEVRRRFDAHLGPGGVRVTAPQRIDLLRRVG